MVKLSRKHKALIAAATALTLALILLVPFVYAQPPTTDPISPTSTSTQRTLYARGLAILNADKSTTYPANFSLVLQKDAQNRTGRFDVASGTVIVNGVPYTITSGYGGVARAKSAILLVAQGTSPDGQPVTLKLAGQYFWMGGHLFVARIVAKLQTDAGNYTMGLRAAIKV
jgi:hypothetical protein